MKRSDFMLLGGVWWLCWSPSGLGLVILLVAIARRIFGHSPQAEERVGAGQHFPNPVAQALVARMIRPRAGIL